MNAKGGGAVILNPEFRAEGNRCGATPPSRL